MSVENGICVVCNQKFATYAILEAHEKTIHPHGTYRCTCNRYFHGHIERDVHWATCSTNLRRSIQMTTDHELLARIDEHFELINDCIGYSPRYGYQPSVDAIKSALRAVVELKLGDDKYPTDIFPELTDTDKENLKVVHEMFPNLIGRVDASACRRAFGIAEHEVREAIEKELG